MSRASDSTVLYYYRARYYSPSLQRFTSEDPLGYRGGGPNFYAYVGDNPVNLWDPFGLSSDYNEQQTPQLFLQPAYSDATAGFFQGLFNTFNHSKGHGDYDFGQNPYTMDDTFTRCGKKMTASEFGNYMAGFQTGAWDDAFYGDREIGFSLDHLWQLRYAEATARAFGVGFHLANYIFPGQTLAQNDPWDKTGFPWITLGADDGRGFNKGKCGCN